MPEVSKGDVEKDMTEFAFAEAENKKPIKKFLWVFKRGAQPIRN